MDECPPINIYSVKINISSEKAQYPALLLLKREFLDSTVCGFLGVQFFSLITNERILGDSSWFPGSSW
jgi:hypothetical protein